MALRKHTLLLFIPFALLPLFTGCMTSSRQDQLQHSIDGLEEKVNKLQGQLAAKDQQINNTTQTALSSQNDVQSLHDQLQLTQGAISELKNKIKTIEQTAGTESSPVAPGVVNISSRPDVSGLQKQIARLELLQNAGLGWSRKGKMPVKIKNETVLADTLKTQLDNGDFKKAIDLSTMVLTAQSATDSMLAVALDFRGEAKFQLQDYRGAALDLSLVTSRFPTHPRQARALLLTGDSYVYLKNSSVASLYYQDCVKSFGATAEGKAASGRLTNLQQGTKS